MPTKSMLLLSCLFAAFAPLTIVAQNVGIGTTTPAASAALDVSSTTKGILAPRMTLAQRNAIATPATGLMIYQTDGTAGLYTYNGSAWQAVTNEGGFFTAGASTITYSNSAHFGKPFLVNTNSVSYFGLGDNPPYHYKMMFLPDKEGAFRVGSINTTNWNSSNIGISSFASGLNSIASGFSSTAMGYKTTASGPASTAIGIETIASGEYSTATGRNTTASGWYSTAMGNGTTASGNTSTAMGFNTTASDGYSTAIGYYTNASGFASIAMGSSTTASGSHSTAIGSYVSTNGREGALVIGDNSTNNTLVAAVNNSFRARFAGGYRFYTSAAASNTESCLLAAGDNAWSTTSDSRLKENFEPVNGDVFLKKIALMPLGSWNYISQNPNLQRHYGPMAQDFFAAFGKDQFGTIGNDTTINTADFDGVNLIAIQALEKRTQKIEMLEKENNAIRKTNDELKEMLLLLRKDVDELKKIRK